MLTDDWLQKICQPLNSYNQACTTLESDFVYIPVYFFKSIWFIDTRVPYFCFEIDNIGDIIISYLLKFVYKELLCLKVYISWPRGLASALFISSFFNKLPLELNIYKYCIDQLLSSLLYIWRGLCPAVKYYNHNQLTLCSCFSCLMSSSAWSRMAAILVWSWPAYRSPPAAAPRAISSRKLLWDDLKRFTGCSSL